MSEKIKPIGARPIKSKLTNPIEKSSTTSKALNLCHGLELFHNQDGYSYAVTKIDDHHEIYEVYGKYFKRWLSAKYFKETKKGISTNVLKEVLDTLDAKAHCEGAVKETFVRMAMNKEKIYIDLCNSRWQCVEIDADRWRILDKPPIMFVRKEGMSELPSPLPGGDLNILERFFNIYNSDFPLIVAWILGSLRGKAPYPILILQGEQGSGKSTATEILRRLVDPSNVPLRGVINDERDLVVSASCAHMIVMDNTSYIKPHMSDTLCRMSTGGGFSRRRLYSDCDEVLIKLSNPIVINGISGLPERPDLLERSLFVEMPSVTSNRKTHQEIMDDFEKELPMILGAIYTALSGAIRERPSIHLDHPPRMADFAYFIAAAEKALGWKEGTIINCMDKNQQELAENCIDSNTFISGVLEFMKARTEYAGTANQLLNDLNKSISSSDEVYRQCPYWPKSPHKVGQLLSRYSPYLKRMGYAVARTRSPDKQSKRIINICLEE